MIAESCSPNVARGLQFVNCELTLNSKVSFSSFNEKTVARSNQQVDYFDMCATDDRNSGRKDLKTHFSSWISVMFAVKSLGIMLEF